METARPNWNVQLGSADGDLVFLRTVRLYFRAPQTGTVIVTPWYSLNPDDGSIEHGQGPTGAPEVEPFENGWTAVTFRFNAVAAKYLRVTLSGIGVLHIADIVVDAVPESSFHHVPARGPPAAATTSLQSETAGMFETFGTRRCVGTKAATAAGPPVFEWQTYGDVWQQVGSLAFGLASLFTSPQATPADASPCGHPLASSYWHEHLPQMKGPFGIWHCDVCLSSFPADTGSHRHRCTGGCDFDVCGTCVAGKGDATDPRPTVAICGPNGPDWVVTWLAAIQLGLTHVPVDFSCSPDRKAYIIEKSVSNILVCPLSTAAALIPLLQGAVDGSSLQHVVIFDAGTAAEVTALQQLAAARGIAVSFVRALQDAGAGDFAADGDLARARLCAVTSTLFWTTSLAPFFSSVPPHTRRVVRY